MLGPLRGGRRSRDFEAGLDARVSRYRIDRVVDVTGGVPRGLEEGAHLVRIEGAVPVRVPAHAGLAVFRGVTQHLGYTTRPERGELEARSRSELPPSPDTVGVLIPIAKARAWWRLAQDERRTYFERREGHEGHTAIGREHADRVFPRLYHCRYVDGPAPYDFLTYFEFERAHANIFERMLGTMRDPERNPEWRFVTREFEVWLEKLA